MFLHFKLNIVLYITNEPPQFRIGQTFLWVYREHTYKQTDAAETLFYKVQWFTITSYHLPITWQINWQIEEIIFW